MLDFPSFPQWASAHIRSIQQLDSNGSPSASQNADGPAVGSKLKVELKGMTFSPVVVVSNPRTAYMLLKTKLSLFFRHVVEKHIKARAKCKISSADKHVSSPLTDQHAN